MFILAGDIGGTTARFGVYDEQYSLSTYKEVPTTTISSFQQTTRKLFEEFSKEGFILRAVSIAFAGPVNKHGASLTNQDLNVTRKELGLLPVQKTYLLNDVEAYGYGVTQGNHEHLTGPEKGKGTKAVLTVGTGVGKAIIASQTPPLVLPSEGGHKEPPYSVLSYLKEESEEEIGVLTIEDILGGRNIQKIHKVLTGKDESLEEIFGGENNKTINFIRKTLTVVARNFALTTKCEGGLYLGGGVIQKHPSLLHRLKTRFSEHPTHRELLQNIPLYKVNNPQTGLKGAAVYATQYDDRHKHR